MRLINDPNKPRDLYHLFRDGLFADAIENHDLARFDRWKLMSKVHIGKQPTMSLIRKMIKRMEREFPGGVKTKKNDVIFTEEFLAFIKTHFEMGSSNEDAIQAWKAMSSLIE